MKRIESAIIEGRCVLCLGKRAQAESAVLDGLRNRSDLRCISIGTETVEPLEALSEEALQPATSAQGGVVVLLDPDTSADADGLKVLDELVNAATR